MGVRLSASAEELRALRELLTATAPHVSLRAVPSAVHGGRAAALNNALAAASGAWVLPMQPGWAVDASRLSQAAMRWPLAASSVHVLAPRAATAVETTLEREEEEPWEPGGGGGGGAAAVHPYFSMAPHASGCEAPQWVAPHDAAAWEPPPPPRDLRRCVAGAVADSSGWATTAAASHQPLSAGASGHEDAWVVQVAAVSSARAVAAALGDAHWSDAEGGDGGAAYEAFLPGVALRRHLFHGWRAPREPGNTFFSRVDDREVHALTGRLDRAGTQHPLQALYWATQLAAVRERLPPPGDSNGTSCVRMYDGRLWWVGPAAAMPKRDPRSPDRRGALEEVVDDIRR
jgi:hypothetical protein